MARPDEPLAMDYYFSCSRTAPETCWSIRGSPWKRVLDEDGALIVPPLEALARLGFAAESISEVLITHFHYDHIGNVAAFPDAELLVSDRELAFWTGPLADRPHFAAYVEATEIDHIVEAHRAGRVRSLGVRENVAPGITTMHVGGHCPGQLIVVVNGIEGPIVLTSDAVHYYEELDLDRPFAVLVDLEEMYAAYTLLRELAAVPDTRLVAAHDPAVLDRFPHVTDDGGLLGVRVRSACSPARESRIDRARAARLRDRRCTRRPDLDGHVRACQSSWQQPRHGLGHRCVPPGGRCRAAVLHPLLAAQAATH